MRVSITPQEMQTVRLREPKEGFLPGLCGRLDDAKRQARTASFELYCKLSLKRCQNELGCGLHVNSAVLMVTSSFKGSAAD
jgi:hypothetical protein